jgi:adenosylmethionine-8-amino-7-oxononanoate aminotransferase
MPDAMVLSKQLSSYQPIAAVMINDNPYQGIADQSRALGDWEPVLPGVVTRSRRP